MAFDLILGFKWEPDYLVSQRRLVEDLPKFHVVSSPPVLSTQRKLPENSGTCIFVQKAKILEVSAVLEPPKGAQRMRQLRIRISDGPGEESQHFTASSPQHPTWMFLWELPQEIEAV